MTKITDAEVEAAARAIVVVLIAEDEDSPTWDDATPLMREQMRGVAKAALEAAEAVRVKGIDTVDTPTIPECFIPWHGGECPVASGTKINVKYLDGRVGDVVGDAEKWRWTHDGSRGDIIAYRIHKPADFRLEAGKFYVTASGERVGPIERGSYGWFMITERRLYWHEDGTCGKKSGPDHDNHEILALSSNQENSHD